MAGKEKTILIISPQPWGEMHVSKHHYAIELERSGNVVYFLNPPVRAYIINAEIYKPDPGKNLYVVQSGFPNILFLRYHMKAIYRPLVNLWLRKITKLIPPIDLVWCFDTNLITDLSFFKGAKKIFHIVDPINAAMVKTAETADLTIGVSNRILNQLNGCAGKKQVINHALSEVVISKATRTNVDDFKPGKNIHVGYVGNLSRSIIDTRIIYRVAAENQTIHFHFWGPGINSNLGGESNALVEKLHHLPNVFFYQPVPSENLVEAISGMDAFILAYKNIPGVYDSSNSHKILEYFATGKMLISTYIDQYSGNQFKEYLQMTPENENEKFPLLFTKVVSNIELWNSRDKIEKRRQFAFSNSYSSNVRSIFNLLEQ